MTQPTTPAPVDPALTQRIAEALERLADEDCHFPLLGDRQREMAAETVLAELAPELARAEQAETALTRARKLADRWDRYGTRDLKRYADILRTALTGPAEDTP